MSNVIASLEKVLLPFAVKIGKQPHVNAIKNGFIRLMPLTLAGAMFVLINNVFLSFGEGSFFYSMGIRLDASTIETLNGLKGIGGNVYNGTLGIMSLMAPFFIGMALAEERKVDALAAGLLSVAAFMTVTPYSVGEAYAVGANWLGGANIISGIIIGLVVAEMFTFIVRRNWVIKLPDSVPASVSRSFSALIPGFIILSIMGIISWALSNYGSNFHQIIMDTISTPLASLGSVVGWAYVIFVPLLWFFGIHGSLALTALDSGIMTPWALENISIYQQYGSVDAALEAGKTFHIWAKPMLDSYIFLGGSGATPHPRITRFDEKVLGLIHTIKGFEVAASNAALSGNFNDVLLALNLSPLVHSDRDAEVLARELILAHEKWLPNFAACIEALKGKHH